MGGYPERGEGLYPSIPPSIRLWHIMSVIMTVFNLRKKSKISSKGASLISSLSIFNTEYYTIYIYIYTHNLLYTHNLYIYTIYIYIYIYIFFFFSQNGKVSDREHLEL